MARTVNEIKNEMTNRFVTNENIIAAYNLESGKTFDESFSSVSIENIFFYIIAFCAWTIETLFDIFKVEVNNTIALQKPHTLRWYTEKAKAFQYGCSLPVESDVYDNTNLTSEQVAASKIVKYAAAVREERPNGRYYLRIKVAKDGADQDLDKLSIQELQALQEYFNRIGDAGVDIEVTSHEADQLFQKWVIYYDPILLDAKGDYIDKQKDNAEQPVRNAIKEFLKTLTFNGSYVSTYHIDHVQQVEGVVAPVLRSCAWQSSADATKGGIVEDIQPTNAGYLRFPDPENETLEIEYKPQTELR